jgi:galactokinase/galacturonokinase
MKCVETFESIYNREPEAVAFCPYRICPVGAHSDHQHGKITGLAIDKGVHIAYKPKQNGVVELVSLQFPKRAQWHIKAIPEVKENDWADMLRGATIALSKRYPLHVGISGVIEGTLPIGGLSSSAAVILSFLSALAKVNQILLTPQELITMALSAENDYVGVSCGKLDQSCEVYSVKDHLLYLDTLDDSFELIPTSPNMKPYEIVVFFSGVERSLAGSKFNMRVDECRSAAYSLMAYAGIEYGRFKETYLRDVPYEVFLQYKDRLPDTFRKRAEHWYTEFERVQKGAEAWRKGDIEAYGKLSFESGHSSIYNWETGSPELKELYDLMCRTDGIYGGRFSGAGFKGCCMALVDPQYREAIIHSISDRYLKTFPELEGKYSVHVCQSADGVRGGTL